MFGLITMAMLIDRDVSVYNVLAVSCLVLLMWDPYYIADVGFQLSYIAVAGIVYLYPMLYRVISDTDVLKTRIKRLNTVFNESLRWAWGLICVSIAAQIATFPVSLYYFHTFPNFFLLSNLLVIPLSNFVLISGMGLFAVGWSERLVSWIGWIFDHLLIILNKIVFGIDALPHALAKGIVISTFEMVMLYAVIMLICWYMTDRRAKVFISCLCFVLVLCTAFSINHIQRDSKRELVVYHVSGKKAIAIIDRGTAYYDFDSALIHAEMLMRYNIRDHWYAAGVKRQIMMDSMNCAFVLPCGKLYEVHGKRIIVIDEMDKQGHHPRTGSQAGTKLKTDVVILSGAKCNIKEVGGEFEFSQLVFDTSNKPWRVKKWKEECDSLHVKYHDCRNRAFVMEW